MAYRKLPHVVAAAGLIGACASAAMMPAADGASGTDATAVTLTPVVVDADGRMTAQPRAVAAVPAGPVAVERVSVDPAPLAVAEGEATYYASKFDGRRSASGVIFRNAEAYAAHRSYPFGTIVRVTNLVNNRSAVVEVIDRGPHGSSARAKRTIIDLSQSIARELDFIRAGRIPIRVEVLEWGGGRI